jgi:hypothetical protein
VFVFLGVLEGDGDGAAHIIVLVVDWQFDFIFSTANFMILLVFLGIEFDIDIYSPRESSKEGTDLVLCP